VGVVGAGNRDLCEEVAGRRFREDLFSRLDVMQLQVPALRERRGDLPSLIEYFLDKYGGEHGRSFEGITAEAMELLLAYRYPGNVRELENIIERAVALGIGDMVTPDALPYVMMQKETFTQVAVGLELPDEGLKLEDMVAELEQSLIIKALKRTRGHRTDAAKLLGISFRSMRYRLDKYDIIAEDFA